MNSSRALLLAALMTVTAPVFMFASEGNPTPTQGTTVVTPPAQTPPVVEPSALSKIGSGICTLLAFLPITMPDAIAKTTLHKVADMAWLKDGNIASVLKNDWTGRLAVYAAAYYVATKINQVYQQMQNDSADEQQLLFEDENNF